MKRLKLSQWAPIVCLIASVGMLVHAALIGAGLNPAFRLGVAESLMLTFGLVWLFGIRYPDVAWMVVISSILSFGTLLEPSSPPEKWEIVAVGTSHLALILAFGAFLFAFFRLKAAAHRMEGIFVAGTLAFGLAGAAMPLDQFLSLRLGGEAQAYLASALLGFSAVHGVLSLKPLPPKRQKYAALMIVACFVGAICYLVAGRMTPLGQQLRTPLLDAAFAGVLALFLFSDLVIFHRNYLRDLMDRNASGGEAQSQAETRLELGRSVRELLLPKELSGTFHEFHYRFDFRPSDALGGDWMYVYDLGGERRILFGDVAGKGAQAALGVAAIVSFLREAENRRMPVGDTLRFLNRRLLDLFERQLTTTAMAVSLAEDGSVELFNAGGAGFFTMTREGALHLPLASGPLGVSTELEIGHAPIPLDHLDLLMAGTDGVIDGQTGVNAVLDYFDEQLDVDRSLEVLEAQVLKLQAGVREPDDRTLLVVQRRFAETVRNPA